MTVNFNGRALAAALLLGCASCAVPHFDVPNDSAGQPNAATIVARVECEIWQMVRKDRPDDPKSFNRRFLLNNDIDMEAVLTLDITTAGGLAPSLSGLTPFNAAESVAWSVGLNLSESRDHNFTEYLSFNARDVYLDAIENPDHYKCPEAETPLAGELGIADFVSLAASSENLHEDKTLAQNGAFGGSIKFIIKKDVTSAGPLWKLTRFSGPGPLASLSSDNTDTLSIAFARGKNAGKRMAKVTKEGPRQNPATHEMLQQIVNSSIATQLSNIRNTLH